MKKLRIVFVITVLLIFNPSNLYAMNNQVGTIITYEAGGNNFNMDITVSGKGSVSDGKEVLKDQTRNYVLTSMESKKFTLKPDQGSSVQRVVINERDVTATVESNAFTVTVVDDDVEVGVYFGESTITEDEPKKDSSTINKSKGSNINTGDSTTINGWLLVGVVALVTGIVLYKKNKRV